MNSGLRKWIEKRIKKLVEKSEELKEINPVATNQFQAWTGLKLIMLSIVINFYKTILESNDYFENIYFIDALSGSGICDLKDYPESFIGSPIIVSELAGNFFTKMYFIDQDDEYTDTLEKRLDYMVQNEEFELKEKNYEILNGDANKKIPQVVKKIRDETNFEACNYLAFIDNQGFNVEWKAMKELLKPYGDLLINFQTGSNAREWGNAKSGNSKSIKKLNNFFGVEYTSEDWSKIEGRDGLRELYMKMLKNNGRPVQEYIKVKGRKNKSFHYDMIYCTRETSMGSPYKKVIEDIKPKIERHTGDSVEKIIDIMKGKHSSLDYFYETEKDKDQKELGDF